MTTDSLLFNLTTDQPKKKKTEIPVKIKLQDGVNKGSQHQITDHTNRVFNKTKPNHFSEYSQEKRTDGPHSSKQKHSLHSSSIFTGNPVALPLFVNKQNSISEPLFSTKTFDDLSLHPHLVSCLKSRLDIVKVTNVQNKTIPVLLEGRDALIKSCTGSGKTLAYAVPIVAKLQKMEPKIKRSDGVHALIIVPTRELALQCFETLSTLTKAFTWIVPGYLIGGEKKKSEKARLRKGINILISTPGRLLDHLEHTACLSLGNIRWLVIDEADRLLEQGFQEAITTVLAKCNANRQSVLLSATLSKEVENLAGVSLVNPIRVDISSGSEKESSEFQDLVIPAHLKQFVVVVPPKLRLTVLSGFIVDRCLKGGFKGLIFMCSQGCVDFHFAILSEVLTSILSEKGEDCKFFKLHGNMKQEDRTEVFSEFKSVKEGVLLCTDVAARGLDLPCVDWIVQYSAPHSPEIYVHRVGRTARIGNKGNSLLFLLPEENKFSNLLSESKIDFEEIPWEQYLQALQLISEMLLSRGKMRAEDCATALQKKYEDLVYEEKALHQSAKDAFVSYVQSYASYPKNIRHILPFKLLHLGHVAKSFCLQEAPSELGSRLPYVKHLVRNQSFRQTSPSRSVKRKVEVSEYGSGLTDVKFDFGRKPKKKKH